MGAELGALSNRTGELTTEQPATSELVERIRFYLNEASFGATFTDRGQAEMRELRDQLDALTAQPEAVNATDDQELVERAILDFVEPPKWQHDAGPPEDNAEWRAGYEAAQLNLREALRPWWPFGGPLRLSSLSNENGVRVRDAYEHAAKVADYAIERAERDWRNPDKQEAVKQVGAEIAEVIRHYARTTLASTSHRGIK